MAPADDNTLPGHCVMPVKDKVLAIHRIVDMRTSSEHNSCTALRQYVYLVLIS
jgi:hypothetical protein